MNKFISKLKLTILIVLSGFGLDLEGEELKSLVQRKFRPYKNTYLIMDWTYIHLILLLEDSISQDHIFHLEAKF